MGMKGPGVEPELGEGFEKFILFTLYTVGLLLFAGFIAGLCYGAYSWSSSPTIVAQPTERQRQEAGARAVLNDYGRPGQSNAELDRGAKRVADEWERVQRSGAR